VIYPTPHISIMFVRCLDVPFPTAGYDSGQAFPDIHRFPVLSVALSCQKAHFNARCMPVAAMKRYLPGPSPFPRPMSYPMITGFLKVIPSTSPLSAMHGIVHCSIRNKRLGTRFPPLRNTQRKADISWRTSREISIRLRSLRTNR
jgi:hypothetical protein